MDSKNKTFTKNYLKLLELGMDQEGILVTDKLFEYILESLFSNDILEIKSILKNARDVKYKFGTKEFTDKNFNTHYACMYACWNCYAWNEAYQRKRDYWKDWGVKMDRRAICNKKWRRREDDVWIMYPSTHDVLPEIIDDCFQAIQNMLDANINVLWVTKPSKEVMIQAIDRFREYRKGQPRIKIRMTIGTDNERLLSFWEPKAPNSYERRESLKMAFEAGYETSVNCEPFYPCLPRKESRHEIEDFAKFVQELLTYVNEVLIIGMMNHIPVTRLRGKLLTGFQKNMVLRLKDFYKLDNVIYL